MKEAVKDWTILVGMLLGALLWLAMLLAGMALPGVLIWWLLTH